MRPLQTYRKQAFSPMTAYLPVVRREGSRPLLAALRQRQPIGQPVLHRNFTAISPPASPSYKCARTARTPYLLFLIYYLLFAPPGHSRPRWCTLHCFSIMHKTKNSPTVFRKAVLWCTLFGTLPRPKNAPLGLCCRSVRKATDTPCSRPQWCTLHCFSITHITKKQPYGFP